MGTLDDSLQKMDKEREERLYDIHNRPFNELLWMSVLLQCGFCAAVAGGLLFVIGACARLDDGYALLGLIGLGGLSGVWWCARILRRKGRKNRSEYLLHGGNPAGTSDLLLGAMVYEITPDGRWKWPEPSTGGE
ncbi:MAG TPA: hypothetical protein VFN00_10725 [Arthrobacter sp.]|nr:hypothetical protein [Arthrobacter sp.]